MAILTGGQPVSKDLGIDIAGVDFEDMTVDRLAEPCSSVFSR